MHFSTVCIFIVTIVFLSACSLFPQLAKEEVDPPKENVTYEEDVELTDEGQSEDGEEGKEGTVQTELYLIDKHGFVVPQTFHYQTRKVSRNKPWNI